MQHKLVNFSLRKTLREYLNEAISLAEIASFRFPRNIFLNRKLTVKHLDFSSQ